jgi:hypothetical protein
MSSTQLKLLLLDADVVIRCHMLGIWQPLKSCCRIALPATVVDEAQFFKSSKGSASIDLPSQVGKNEVERLEGSIDELLAAVDQFVPSFCDGLHDGEKEALGLLIGGRFSFDAFCTGDTNAIVAASMLGHWDTLISLETLVARLGLRAKLQGPIPAHMSERSLRYQIEVGKQNRITRLYFKSQKLLGSGD